MGAWSSVLPFSTFRRLLIWFCSFLINLSFISSCSSKSWDENINIYSENQTPWRGSVQTLGLGIPSTRHVLRSEPRRLQSQTALGFTLSLLVLPQLGVLLLFLLQSALQLHFLPLKFCLLLLQKPEDKRNNFLKDYLSTWRAVYDPDFAASSITLRCCFSAAAWARRTFSVGLPLLGCCGDCLRRLPFYLG